MSTDTTRTESDTEAHPDLDSRTAGQDPSRAGEPATSAATVGPVEQAVRQAKPKLRGWLHFGMAPLALAAGIVLVVLARSPAGHVGAAIFLAASLMLFGTSGIYHRFTWSDKADGVLRRMDHANIYVFIAATYTPMALLLLDGSARVIMLTLVWVAALGGLAFRLLWLNAPRWFYTALYLAMGWAAVGWMPQIFTNGGPVVFTLIILGGVFYTVGAVVYGRKRPDPSPTWFGFHEIFHSFTIAAFVAHYVAISMITYAA